MFSFIVLRPLIPSAVILIVLVPLFIIAYLVLPFLFLSNKRICNKSSLKNANDANINGDYSVFKSVTVQANKVIFVKNEGVRSAKVQIATKTSKKYVGKYVLIDFRGSDTAVVEFKNDIEMINVLVKEVNNEKKEKGAIVGPKIWMYLVVALAEGLACAIGIMLYAYSNSGYLPKRYDTYAVVWFLAALGIVVAVASVILNRIFLNISRKGGK